MLTLTVICGSSCKHVNKGARVHVRETWLLLCRKTTYYLQKKRLKQNSLYYEAGQGAQVVKRPGGQAPMWSSSNEVKCPGGQALRWSSAQVVKRPGSQAPWCSRSPVLKRTGTQAHRCSSAHVFRRPGVQAPIYSKAQTRCWHVEKVPNTQNSQNL